MYHIPMCILRREDPSFHQILKEVPDSKKADSINRVCESELTSWVKTWLMHKQGQCTCGLLPASLSQGDQ